MITPGRDYLQYFSLYLIFIRKTVREGLAIINIAINYWLLQAEITFNIFQLSDIHRTAREGLAVKNIARNYWFLQGGITFHIFHLSNTHRTAREGLAVKNIARNYWLLQGGCTPIFSLSLLTINDSAGFACSNSFVLLISYSLGLESSNIVQKISLYIFAF